MTSRLVSVKLQLSCSFFVFFFFFWLVGQAQSSCWSVQISVICNRVAIRWPVNHNDGPVYFSAIVLVILELTTAFGDQVNVMPGQ